MLNNPSICGINPPLLIYDSVICVQLLNVSCGSQVIKAKNLAVSRFPSGWGLRPREDIYHIP